MIERECPCCGQRTKAQAPAGVTAPVQYGPRAAAVATYLWHGHFLSRDRARGALGDMSGCAPPPGAIAAMARKISGFISPGINAIVEALVASGVVYSNSPPPGPDSLSKRGVNIRDGGALPPMPGLSRFPVLLREPLAGTTVQTIPGTLGHLPAWFSQFKCMNRLGKLGAIHTSFRLTSEGSLVRTQLRPPSFCS
jgi:hypothetical protein